MIFKSKMAVGFMAGMLALMLPLATAPARGQVAKHYYVPSVPERIEAVEFYLLTVGVGEDVASRFGHTGIRIKNPDEGTDVVFNWGKFYFDQPHFLWKFFRGSLTYSMGVRTYQADVGHYLQTGQRLVMDHLNLTASQKRRLYERIAWNAQPEHREFAYQYWYKNCSTIPRDYLDAVLGGALRRQFAGPAPEAVAFRHYVRRNLGANLFAVPVLDIVMNGNIDRPITGWEEMFLPTKLRDGLAALPEIDDGGRERPGTHLLDHHQVVLDRQEAFAAAWPDYMLAVAPVWLFLVAALVAFYRRAAVGWRLLGVAAMVWGIEAGILGLTLALNWAFSGHPDGWHNVNLMVFWPLDFAYLGMGWRLARGGGQFRDRWPLLGAGKIYCMAHVAAFAVLLGLAATGVVRQNIWLAAVWFGAPLLVLNLSLALRAFAGGWRAWRPVAKGAGPDETLLTASAP